MNLTIIRIGFTAASAKLAIWLYF